ncbi:MAG: ABC transporter permease subunit [Burkholderiales bacterium]
MYQYDFNELLVRVILPGLADTFIMLFVSAVTCGVLGFAVALTLVTTDPRGLRPSPLVNRIVSGLVSLIWAMPYIVLAISILPITRMVVGTSIGVWAGIFAITFAAFPLIARLLENSFKEVNPSLIEAARSLGATDAQITFRVIVAEAVPSVVAQSTLGWISLLHYTTTAGLIGAGGLGAVALTYGYQNFNDRVMYGTVMILVVIVALIQLGGNALYRWIKQ